MVKLRKADQQEFDRILSRYLEEPEVRKMDTYKAHGKVSVLQHSLDVAKMAYYLDKRFKVNADTETLLTGAILHDFYGYDWHQKKLDFNIFKMHGFTHPGAACENAINTFHIDDRTQEVIRSHMWPLTMRSVPKHKEAILVCIADKLVALKETVLER
ncbi:MAG: HD domain-containing protein [Erysipelotrichaceae bacterium]|nr:HD domain-containing protein [Erysipelotrichaceae bacterium]